MKIFKAIVEAAKDFLHDECMVSGAALAYYTIFSLPPILIILFAVAGWFGVEADRIDTIVKQQVGLPITDVTGSIGHKEEPNSSESDESSDAEEKQTVPSEVAGFGWLSRIFGIGLLFFTATSLFAQFQHALNRVWKVQRDPNRKVLRWFLLKRILSLGMVAIIAFMLLVSLVLTMMVDEMIEWTQGPKATFLMFGLGMLANNLITLFVATVLFAVMFKVLPDAKTSWKDMFVGSFLTALLFVTGKSVISWYLQNSEVGSSWEVPLHP
ncbi:MAG: YihY/virulence factor BrkB family protein [Planctomycetaceae bacterium]